MIDRKNYHDMIEEAASFIGRQTTVRPVVGAVLGSGLGVADLGFAKDIEEIPYGRIPHLPTPTVPGHAGKLVLCNAGGRDCAILSGRVHLYEGWDCRMVAFAVRVLARMGCRAFFLTNAAGAVNPAMRPGSLVLLSDHLNLTGEDPTRGTAAEPGSAGFTSMVNAYDAETRRLLVKAAGEEKIMLQEGVYAALKGPCYETPAEIRMLRAAGADLVGMSTALETIALRREGAKVAAVSCVTNLGAGIEGSNPNHEEVKLIAAKGAADLMRLFRRFAELVPA